MYHHHQQRRVREQGLVEQRGGRRAGPLRICRWGAAEALRWSLTSGEGGSTARRPSTTLPNYLARRPLTGTTPRTGPKPSRAQGGANVQRQLELARRRAAELEAELIQVRQQLDQGMVTWRNFQAEREWTGRELERLRAQNMQWRRGLQEGLPQRAQLQLPLVFLLDALGPHKWLAGWRTTLTDKWGSARFMGENQRLKQGNAQLIVALASSGLARKACFPSGPVSCRQWLEQVIQQEPYGLGHSSGSGHGFEFYDNAKGRSGRRAPPSEGKAWSLRDRTWDLYVDTTAATTTHGDQTEDRTRNFAAVGGPSTFGTTMGKRSPPATPRDAPFGAGLRRR